MRRGYPTVLRREDAVLTLQPKTEGHHHGKQRHIFSPIDGTRGKEEEPKFVNTMNGLDAGGSGGTPSEYNRPRRPNADTIAYLRGLPLDVETARSEIAAFRATNENPDDFPQSLAAAFSAIDEVRLEIASLAGDEYGSQSIEILAQISAPYSDTAARVLLAACSGYHLHLATHRYGSHVIQSLLQLAVSSSSETDLALHDEAPQFSDSVVESLPALPDLVRGMVEELRDSASQLAIHVCGSHVLRTLLCVLGGVNLASSTANDNRVASGAILRGRKKNKKKKKRAPDDQSTIPHAGTMRIEYRKESRISPDDFSSDLTTLATSLLGTPSTTPGELQQLACHPSAGPLLIILLRVLTYSSDSAKRSVANMSEGLGSTIADFRLGIARPEPKCEIDSVAHRMMKQLLCWDDESAEQKHTGDVIYGYSGEVRGSHMLETLMRLAPDEVYDDIIKYGGFENPGSLQEYSEHAVSNFVVQTLLTTVRSKEKAEILLKALDKVISSGLAVDPSKKRRGILWRACELAAKYRVGQDSLMKAMRLGFVSLRETTQEDGKEDAPEEKKKKQRKKASAVDIQHCVLELVNLKMQDKDAMKISLDPVGTRSVYHMLRFTPRLCEETLGAITEMFSQDELELLARDGLGSRCIMDGILCGPTKTPVFGVAVKALLGKLSGRWVALSTDRVGHHTVKNMFLALPKIDDKAKLVEELVLGGNRLNGNTMGRSVVEACLVNEYNENRKEWRRMVAKTLTKDDNFLDEMVAGNTDDAEDLPQKTKSKRKRKRKRPEKESGLEGEESVSKKQTSAHSSLETSTIIEAMSATT